jgi:hypothetical protein
MTSNCFKSCEDWELYALAVDYDLGLRWEW